MTLLNRRQFLSTTVALSGIYPISDFVWGQSSGLELSGTHIKIVIRPYLGLDIHSRDSGRLLWNTSIMRPPEIVVLKSGAPLQSARTFALRNAICHRSETFAQGSYRGYRLRLSSFPASDVKLELVLALDREKDELLVEAAQSGGEDRVRQANHLYRIEKATTEGGSMVVPHGCGYLISYDTAQRLTGGGIIGYRYTLPLFGMIKPGAAFYQIVDTHWDCDVVSEHIPSQYSALDFTWLPSLGELRYRRRFIWKFGSGIDHVDMAKAYRRYVQSQGNLRTLVEKSETLPAIKRYVSGIEYRWTGWQNGKQAAVLSDIDHFKEDGLKINFFFPKWSSVGYLDKEPWQADAGWQSYLRTEPIPEGWRELDRLAHAAHSEGALIKLMIMAHRNIKEAPDYDPNKTTTGESGEHPKYPELSPHYFPQAAKLARNRLLAMGLEFDALYFDGFSAYQGPGEDFSPQHRVTRRQAEANELLSFRETAGQGIIPGAELPRFWSVAECAFFFFDTGWAADILHIGDPIPLFQLVFRDCYSACFSGGGYGKNYDWPADENPRLYELLLGAAPGYNWMLPYAKSDLGPGLEWGVPINDWSSERMAHRLRWLHRWSSYYQTIAFSEMISHEFLNPEHTRQRVEFANNISAEFDLANGLCRVKGVPGFSGNWEKPHEDSF